MMRPSGAANSGARCCCSLAGSNALILPAKPRNSGPVKEQGGSGQPAEGNIPGRPRSKAEARKLKQVAAKRERRQQLASVSGELHARLSACRLNIFLRLLGVHLVRSVLALLVAYVPFSSPEQCAGFAVMMMRPCMSF